MISYIDKKQMSDKLVSIPFKYKTLNFLTKYDSSYYRKLTKNMSDDEKTLFDVKVMQLKSRKEIYELCIKNELPDFWVSNLQEKKYFAGSFSVKYQNIHKNTQRKLEENISDLNFVEVYEFASDHIEYCKQSFIDRDYYAEKALSISSSSMTNMISQNNSNKKNHADYTIEKLINGENDEFVKEANYVIDEIKKMDEVSALSLQFLTNQISRENFLNTNNFPCEKEIRKYYNRKTSITDVRLIFRDYGFIVLVFELLLQKRLEEKNMPIDFKVMN